MRSLFLRSLTLVILSTFYSCQEEITTDNLVGHWKAISFEEKGTIQDLTQKEVFFKFHENGIYEYNSNNSYAEAGPYYVKGKLLYTTDTLSEERLEKSVKLGLVEADSMHFDMNVGGVSQVFKLERQ